MANRVMFLGLPYHVLPFADAVRTLVARMSKRQSTRLYIANANSYFVGRQKPQLLEVLKRADMLFADGSGLLWGSALLGTPLRYNLNGTDLIPAVCSEAAKQNLSVYFLGARPGIASQAAEQLAAGNPGLQIAGVRDGYFPAEQTASVIASIRDSGAHLLLVAFGSPLQETWIDAHASELPGVVCVAVGGLFDFMSGRVRRAPLWIQRIGMEWGWRIAMEPRRLFKRYLVGNTVFLSMLVQEWWRLRNERGESMPAPQSVAE